jgi:hypothetical protein
VQDPFSKSLPSAILITAFLGTSLSDAATTGRTDCEKFALPQVVLKLEPPFSGSSGWYGSQKLAVQLPGKDIWHGMGPSRRFRDKLLWYVPGFRPGLESEFTVDGRRMGGAETLTVSRVTGACDNDIRNCHPLVLVEFARGGCWEIVGRFRGLNLRFVVQVQ